MATIQWFPGHMSKARRQVQENLKYVDIVFELVDARLPMSSRNPMLGKIIGDKPRLLILNKKDLADEKLSIEWQNYFRKEGLNSLLIDSKEQATVKKVTAAAKNVLAEKIARDKARGIQERAIRVMVIGIPNVGKSTILNRLAGKKAAQVGNRPGVTKGQQWIRSNKDLEILDTPGILWPKFEDQLVGLKLALTGAIKDDLIPKDEITIFGMEYFLENYQDDLVKRYKLSTQDLELSPVDLIIYLTKKLGFKEDYDRFYDLFIKDIRDGKLGKFTLDRVEDFTLELEDEED
ncbi:ribosome biogenesis GTPase YlqF [Streptococcaceae bacterium ESL0687]|nr:ribosome biogenesis GTPase YlqF [Streptococcaceae bacterium ESL0687]